MVSRQETCLANGSRHAANASRAEPTTATNEGETCMDYSIATMDPEIDDEPDPAENTMSSDEND